MIDLLDDVCKRRYGVAYANATADQKFYADVFVDSLVYDAMIEEQAERAEMEDV